jgi:hypothetical protein
MCHPLPPPGVFLGMGAVGAWVTVFLVVKTLDDRQIPKARFFKIYFSSFGYGSMTDFVNMIIHVCFL